MKACQKSLENRGSKEGYGDNFDVTFSSFSGMYFFILAASQEVWKHLPSPELLDQHSSTERV